MSKMLLDRRKAPTADQVLIVCEALRAQYGEGVYAFADRQLGRARGDGLARWIAILRAL